MDPTITEDTLPPEADTGIRRFTIQTGDERLILQIRQEAREDCPGEIHPAEGFAPSAQVATNQQLVNACLILARQALANPGQSLPLPVSGAAVSQSPSLPVFPS